MSRTIEFTCNARSMIESWVESTTLNLDFLSNVPREVTVLPGLDLDCSTIVNFLGTLGPSVAIKVGDVTAEVGRF